jgi:hypothetical protein
MLKNPARWVVMTAGVAVAASVAGCDKLSKMGAEDEKKLATASTPSQPPGTTAFPGSGGASSPGAPSTPAAPSAPKSPAEVVQAFQAKPARERTNVDMEELAALPEGLEAITELNLGGSQVGDAGLAHLPKFTEVEKLNVSALRISNEGLKHVGEMPKLRSLAADGLMSVDEGGFAALGKCQGLEDVSMQNTIAADGAFEALKELRELKVLNVGGSPNLMGMGFSKSVDAGAFKELKELYAGGSQFVIYGVVKLDKLKGLEVLDVSYADMNDGLIEGFDECINLKKLSMARSKVTSLGMKMLSKMRKLEELNVSNCPGVNDSAVPFLRTHKALKRLDVDGTSMTADGVKKLKDALPDTVIRFGGADV